MKSKAEEIIFKLKKEKFLNAVATATKSLPIDVPIPKVNFDYCRDSPIDSIAHLHLDTNTICISDGRLSSMTYEELCETAIHEVTHLIEEKHNIRFAKAQNKVKTTVWIREHQSFKSGVVTPATKEKKKDTPKSLTKAPIPRTSGDKDSKRKSILQEIEKIKHLINVAKAMSGAPIYEGGLSREKANKTIELLKRDISKLENDLRHLESINTYGESIVSSSPKPEIFESEKPEFHQEEEKIPESRTLKANDNHICQYCFEKVSQVYKCTKCNLDLCSKHASNHSCIKGSHPEPESGHPTVWVEPQDTPIKSLNWNAIIIIFFGIILSYFIISSFIDNSNSHDPVMPLNFGTDNSETVPTPLLTPKDIFEKINEYRAQNKIYKILWSDDAYRLADFRASDMVKRNYFSRTTPDGKTVSDYIGKYNFYSNSAWGENLCKGCSNPTEEWIGIAGDREVLLGGWGKGAVACESNICVFIGVNEK